MSPTISAGIFPRDHLPDLLETTIGKRINVRDNEYHEQPNQCYYNPGGK
jgi:hypothetical protein